MVRVKVQNDTGEGIVVKEGNAGIYRVLRQIEVGGHFDLSVDLSATYREFLCVESKSGLTVTLTSDDCMDYSEVRIKYDKDSRKLCMDYTLRKNRGIPDATTDANIGKAVKGVASWFGSLFRKKTETPEAATNTANPAAANTANAAGASGPAP